MSEKVLNFDYFNPLNRKIQFSFMLYNRHLVSFSPSFLYPNTTFHKQHPFIQQLKDKTIQPIKMLTISYFLPQLPRKHNENSPIKHPFTSSSSIHRFDKINLIHRKIERISIKKNIPIDSKKDDGEVEVNMSSNLLYGA